MNLRKSSKNEELESSRKSSSDFKYNGNDKKSFKMLNSNSALKLKEDFQGSSNNVLLNEKNKFTLQKNSGMKMTYLLESSKKVKIKEIEDDNEKTKEIRKIVANSSLNKVLRRSKTLFKKNQYIYNPTKVNSSKKHPILMENYSLEQPILEPLQDKSRANSPINNFKSELIRTQLLKNLNSRSDDFIIKSRFDKYDFLLSENNVKDNSTKKMQPAVQIEEPDFGFRSSNKKLSGRFKTDLKLIQVNQQEVLNKPNPAEEIDNKVINQNSSKRDLRIKFQSDSIPNSIKILDCKIHSNQQKYVYESNNFPPNPNFKNIFSTNMSNDRKENILGQNIILKNRVNNGQLFKNQKFNTFNKSKTTKNNDKCSINNINSNNPNSRSILNKDSKIDLNEFQKIKFASLKDTNSNDLDFLNMKKNLNSGITPIRIVNNNQIGNFTNKSNHINNKNSNGNTNIIDNNQQMTSSRASVSSSITLRTKSSSSVNFKAPKFTLAAIEREKHLMHEYIKDHFHNIKEEPIYGKFGRPKTSSRKVDYGIVFNKNRIIYSEDPDFEDYKRLSLDPCIGPKYLEKKYPELYSTCKSFYKYEFKDQFAAKPFKQFLFTKKINKDLDSVKYPFLKKTKFAQISKVKIKWKTIKWLMEHEKNVVKRLVNFHKKFKNNSESEEKAYSREEFYELMCSNGISNNPDLINKLFWVFDENGDEQLKIKELALGLEMFRDSSLEEKLKAFYDLCDEDNSGSVSKGEFLKILKNNLINNDEKSTVKQVVDRIYAYYNLDDKGELTFDKLKEACIHNKALCDIIEKNLYALKSIDNVIDEDLKNNLIVFNHNLSEDLKLKLLDVNSSYMPIRDRKFEGVLDDYTKNRQNVLDYCLEKEERRVNNLLEEDYKNDASIFIDEREYIRKILRSTNKR